mgnify:FL=1
MEGEGKLHLNDRIQMVRIHSAVRILMGSIISLWWYEGYTHGRRLTYGRGGGLWSERARDKEDAFGMILICTSDMIQEPELMRD